jgi:hypothetical protein
VASTVQKLHLFILCGEMSHSSVGVRFRIITLFMDNSCARVGISCCNSLTFIKSGKKSDIFSSPKIGRK